MSQERTPRGRGAGLLRRWRAMRASRSLARINHILIPEKKADRDRYRKGVLWFLLAPARLLLEAHSREGRALLLLTLLVGCASIDVRFTQTHQLFAMLVALVFVSLLVRPLFHPRGLAVEVRAPPRVTAGAPACFELVLRHEGTTPLLDLRIDAPFLPWDGRWLKEPTGVARLAPGGRASVTAEAEFVARGEHHLDSFEVAPLVPPGLTVGRRVVSNGPRFLVVPRIARVTSVRLEHRLPDRRGPATSSLRPGESEIAGVRPYRPGDPLKHLHARTWARTGVPHVRTYADERQDHVALAVVTDGGAATGRVKEATLSLAAGIAARLALHGGGLDLLLVDAEGFEVAPRAGAAALDRVLDRLAVHEVRRDERPLRAALDERWPRLSTLVLVTAGAEPRHAALVEAAGERGVPTRWLAVVEPGEAPAGRGATLVDAGDVEAGRELSL